MLTKVSTIYIVFEELENYYDDNDSKYILAFDNEGDANDYVKKYPQHSYYVETRDLLKMNKKETLEELKWSDQSYN